MKSDYLLGRTGKCIRFTSEFLSSGLKFLNVGCGNAWLEECLTQEIKDMQYFACELDQRRLLNDCQCDKEKVCFTAASALELPYRNQVFDIVTSFDVIEHVPRLTEPEMLNEIKRVLKPGGILLLSTPRQGLFNNIADPAWYFGHRHYSLKKLRALLKDAGFSSDRIDLQGGKHELLETWVHYFFKYIFRSEIPAGIHRYIKTKIAEEKIEKFSISYFLAAHS